MEVMTKMRNGFGLSGVPVDDVLMQEALQQIERMIHEGGFHQVATANVDYLVHATKDPEYRRILCNCDMVVADGMPVVWASHLVGIPLREWLERIWCRNWRACRPQRATKFSCWAQPTR
jgi:N-acetylglucosaminyldiphosphoundecaprenol N-acetyl-beta-D-mannosaminyltransferase